jgi:hypothetical protein
MASCTLSIEIYFEWYKTTVTNELCNCDHCGDLIVSDINILSVFVDFYKSKDVLKLCNSCKD